MADLNIQGKIIQVLEPQGGTSRAGNQWRKQEYVLETSDNYPKKVCFHFFGDRIDQNPLQLGDYINLQFDIESREYNGRWYTDIRGWRAEKIQPGQPVPGAAPNPAGGFAPQQPVAPAGYPQQQPTTFAQPQAAPQPDFSADENTDNLPF